MYIDPLLDIMKKSYNSLRPIPRLHTFSQSISVTAHWSSIDLCCGPNNTYSLGDNADLHETDDLKNGYCSSNSDSV